MSLTQLKNSFNYLMDRLDIDKAQKRKVNPIIWNIASYNRNKNSRFEYSLQVNEKKLQKVLRFVNYDAPSVLKDHADYLYRIELIKDIVLSSKISSPAAEEFFFLIESFKQFYLPVFIGIEVKSKQIGYKLYVNFFNLHKRYPKIASGLIKNFIHRLNSNIEIRNNQIVLLGISISDNGDRDEFKVYYLIQRLINSDKAWFSEKSISIFNWLRNYNKYNYFDIMDRYDSGNITSKKIEIHPVTSKSGLSGLIERIAPSPNAQTINSIISDTNGALEAVAFERNNITFYVTLTNYGSGGYYKVQ